MALTNDVIISFKSERSDVIENIDSILTKTSWPKKVKNFRNRNNRNPIAADDMVRCGEETEVRSGLPWTPPRCHTNIVGLNYIHSTI